MQSGVITRANRICPMGIINMCTKFHGHLSNVCVDNRPISGTKMQSLEPHYSTVKSLSCKLNVHITWDPEILANTVFISVLFIILGQVDIQRLEKNKLTQHMSSHFAKIQMDVVLKYPFVETGSFFM